MSQECYWRSMYMKQNNNLFILTFLFAALLFTSYNSYAKNKANSRAASFKVCVDDAGELIIRARCRKNEEQISLGDLVQTDENEFDGQLVTPGGITVESTADKVSIVADKSTITIDPLGGITIMSDRDLTLSAGGTLNLRGQNVQITSDLDTKIDAGASTQIKSTLNSSISSSAITEVKGSLVKIN